MKNLARHAAVRVHAAAAAGAFAIPSKDGAAEAPAESSSGRAGREARKDYAPPPYTISAVELDFNLLDGASADERATTVASRLTVRRREGAAADADPTSTARTRLVSVAVDGKALAAGAADGYELAADGALTLRGAALPRRASSRAS